MNQDDIIGPWSEDKLQLLGKYLHAYTFIMQGQRWCRNGYHYIDAFAGTGKARARDEERHVDGSPPAALDFFHNIPKMRRILQTLAGLGLGYVKLGQSAPSLSGGEAQRVKLAKELARAATGDPVYILDEPTIGLHFGDIKKLLDVLHRLTDAGNSVVVIEHNLDVINTADWIVGLAPEGGDAGG